MEAGINSLPIYARMLCDMVGLKFTMGGNTAYSTGGLINIPPVPPDNQEAKNLAFGMIMHESGHEADTDYESWPKEAVLARMANRLEDIRIEKRRCKRYPGAQKRLSDMVDGLMRTGYFGPPAEDQSPATLLGSAIYYGLRVDILGQEALSAWADEAIRLAKKVLPEMLVDDVMVIASRVEDVRTTQEVIDLAASILDLIEEEKDKQEEQAKNPPPQQSPQQQQGGQNGEEDEDDNQSAPSQGQGQGQSASEEDEDGQSQGAPGPSGNSQPSGSQVSGGSGSSGEEIDPEAAAKAIQSILDGEDDEAPVDAGQAAGKALDSIAQQNYSSSLILPTAKRANAAVGTNA